MYKQRLFHTRTIMKADEFGTVVSLGTTSMAFFRPIIIGPETKRTISSEITKNFFSRCLGIELLYRP